MNRSNVSRLEKNRIYNSLFIIIAIVVLVGISILYVNIKGMPTQAMVYEFVNRHHESHAVKIIFAAFAGGIIGFEREHKNRPAGLRTHALVSIGAAMVMLIPLELAYEGMETSRMDVTRLGAQVISGIGFLGAGTIIRTGESVKGLTTAASLWVSAIIGLTIGAGNYMTSFISLIIVIFILKIFGIFGHPQVLKYKDLTFDVTMDNLPQHLSLLKSTIKGIKRKLRLQKIEIVENSNDIDRAIIQFKLLVRCNLDTEEDILISQLNNIPGVIKVDGDNLVHLI